MTTKKTVSVLRDSSEFERQFCGKQPLARAVDANPVGRRSSRSDNTSRHRINER